MGIGVVDAAACFPGFEDIVFFDYEDLKTGIDAPVIADVTIAEVSTTADKDYLVGFARVNRLIKGSIAGDVIKVLVGASSCGPYGFVVGAGGLVAGTLRYGSVDLPELIAMENSIIDARRRKNSSANEPSR
jgi:hypothetical protein